MAAVGSSASSNIREVAPALVMSEQQTRANRATVDLRVQLAQSEQETVRARVDKARAQADLGKAQEAIASQRQEIDGLKAKIDQLGNQIEAARVERATLQGALDQEKVTHLILWGKFQLLVWGSSDSQRRIDLLEQQLRSAGERVASLEQELNRIRVEVSRREQLHGLLIEQISLQWKISTDESNAGAFVLTGIFSGALVAGPLGAGVGLLGSMFGSAFYIGNRRTQYPETDYATRLEQVQKEMDALQQAQAVEVVVVPNGLNEQ